MSPGGTCPGVVVRGPPCTPVSAGGRRRGRSPGCCGPRRVRNRAGAAATGAAHRLSTVRSTGTATPWNADVVPGARAARRRCAGRVRRTSRPSQMPGSPCSGRTRQGTGSSRPRRRTPSPGPDPDTHPPTSAGEPVDTATATVSASRVHTRAFLAGLPRPAGPHALIQLNGPIVLVRDDLHTPLAARPTHHPPAAAVRTRPQFRRGRLVTRPRTTPTTTFDTPDDLTHDKNSGTPSQLAVLRDTRSDRPLHVRRAASRLVLPRASRRRVRVRHASRR